LLRAQMERGASGALRWMSTLFPTRAYAIEAEMGFEEYQDFVFRACHADESTPDPVAFWKNVEQAQRSIIERFKDHDLIQVRGPNADLILSIKGRKFNNACGHHNMPDGEIFTGPVEESVQGWVRYTYPAVYQGRVVEGIELVFRDGKVVKATAHKNQDFLHQMLDTDPGARYLGEFAIGTNFEIDRFTRNILFDEKIGGSFHAALGAGYPETGSRNQSIIHWDMICDLRQDSEILVDGEVVYRNGQFVF
jgi:aminopeptidase